MMDAANGIVPDEPEPEPEYKINPLSGMKYKEHICGRCGGTGILEQYRRVNGGDCFNCGGTGYIRRYFE